MKRGRDTFLIHCTCGITFVILDKGAGNLHKPCPECGRQFMVSKPLESTNAKP